MSVSDFVADGARPQVLRGLGGGAAGQVFIGGRGIRDVALLDRTGQPRNVEQKEGLPGSVKSYSI